MRKPSLLFIFLTVFIDLIGFGIVFPLLPKYTEDFGATGLMIGLIIASYSAMQFIFAPMWGRLSDRIGRRPVLLVSTAGFVLSYALFAIGSLMTAPAAALGMILGSRILGGICGANITVAQAYIADITPPEERSKKMGLIGMAFGLGFICGPIIAIIGLLTLGKAGPGWIAAGICLLNLILAFFILGESLKPGAQQAARRPGVSQWKEILARPNVGLLVVVFFLSTFVFTCFESTLARLIAKNFHFDPKTHDGEIAIAAIFAYCGIVGAFVQGGAIGRLVKKMGEPKLIAFSLLLVGISLPMLPYAEGTTPLKFASLFGPGAAAWWFLLFAVGLLAVGSGLTRPPLFGLLSNLTPAHEQGATLGVAQSAGSLARIVGPVFASAMFDVKPSIPYLACGALALATGYVAWKRVVGVKSVVAAA